MSYNIQVAGHKVFPTPEEAKAFEETVREKARGFVRSLEGVTAAHMSGEHTGHTMLHPEPPAETQPA